MTKHLNVYYIKGHNICMTLLDFEDFLFNILLYIIDSIILILFKAITYNLYIYNQRGVTQLINIYFFFMFLQFII